MNTGTSIESAPRGLIQKGTQWYTSIRSQKALQLDRALMITLLQDAQFRQINFFRDYERNPFFSTESRKADCNC